MTVPHSAPCLPLQTAYYPSARRTICLYLMPVPVFPRLTGWRCQHLPICHYTLPCVGGTCLCPGLVTPYLPHTHLPCQGPFTTQPSPAVILLLTPPHPLPAHCETVPAPFLPACYCYLAHPSPGVGPHYSHGLPVCGFPVWVEVMELPARHSSAVLAFCPLLLPPFALSL